MITPSTRKQRIREMILDSAPKLFRRSGIDGTGIDSIMTALQQVALAVGTLTLARMLKGQDLSDEFLKAGVDSSQLLRKPSS